MVAQEEAVEEAARKYGEHGRKKRQPRDRDVQARHKLIAQGEPNDPDDPNEVMSFYMPV